jgi:hypothetical protein
VNREQAGSWILLLNPVFSNSLYLQSQEERVTMPPPANVVDMSGEAEVQLVDPKATTGRTVWQYEVLQQCTNGETIVGMIQDGNVQDLIFLRAMNDIAPYDAPYGKGEERWKRVTDQCNKTSLDGGKTFPLGTAKASTLKGRLKKYKEAFPYVSDKIGVDDDSDATVYDENGDGSRKWHDEKDVGNNGNHHEQAVVVNLVVQFVSCQLTFIILF